MYAQGMQLTHQECASSAEFYNKNQLIMSLPKEILLHIFSYCCTQNIKEECLFNTFFEHCVFLKKVCKCFKTMLTIQVIGELCQGHTIENKNKVLQKITHAIGATNYHIKRPIILALLYSGASADVGKHMKYSAHIETPYQYFSLLHKALIKKDTDLIRLLLKHNADPNQLHPNIGPLFFFAPNIVIADLFLKNGTDFNAKDRKGNNVLWYVHTLSFELINFYIKHNVDTRYINPLDGTCILHILANPSFKYIQDSNNFYKKGVLLIKAIPDMVNTLDKKGKTSIDLMEEKAKREFYKHSTYYGKPFKKLIALYRSFGGKTAQELAREKELHTSFIMTGTHEKPNCYYS